MLRMFTKLCPFDLAKMLESSINTYTIIDTKIFSNYNAFQWNPVNYIWAWHQLEYQANKMAAAQC